jgi:hypothetical protein
MHFAVCFRLITEGVFLFTSLLAACIGLLIGITYQSFLTDQIELVEYITTHVVFGQLSTIIVVTFLILRLSFLLQLQKISLNEYGLIFESYKRFIFIFILGALLAWIFYNSFVLFFYALGIEISNRGESFQAVKSLIIDYDIHWTFHSLFRLLFESLIVSIALIVENKFLVKTTIDPAKAFTRSFMVLLIGLFVIEISDLIFLS